MAPRLKVFVTSDGLTDYVVATSSKVKALAAWGVRQDAFKEGRARETDDPELVAAATARPGEVLRRPASSRGELAKLKPAKRPKAAASNPAAPPRLAVVAPPEPAPRPRPSKAALKRVAALEKQVVELEAGHAKAQAKLARKQAELAQRIEDAAADHRARKAKLEAALSAARQALE